MPYRNVMSKVLLGILNHGLLVRATVVQPHPAAYSTRCTVMVCVVQLGSRYTVELKTEFEDPNAFVL